LRRMRGVLCVEWGKGQLKKVLPGGGGEKKELEGFLEIFSTGGAKEGRTNPWAKLYSGQYG